MLKKKKSYFEEDKRYIKKLLTIVLTNENKFYLGQVKRLNTQNGTDELEIL